MYFVALILLLGCSVFNTKAETVAAATDYWKLDDVVNMFSNSTTNNSTLSSVFSDLTKKATSEFDRLYVQLESVLRPTRVDPAVINENCSCYCYCPHDSVNLNIITDIKDRVKDLRRKLKNVGNTIKEKIHVLTAR